jgi:hypothetical protein
MRLHRRFLIALVLSAGVFSFGAQQLSATVTYIVGTCMIGTTFTKIQAALNASPAPNVVEVCPGVYEEQIIITKPVTLEGVAVGSNDAVLITTPVGGLTINADDDFKTGVAAQILVLATTGVTLHNLNIDGTGANISNGSDLIAGIFFEDSSGSITGVSTVNQASVGNGIGIFLEGGSSNPSVTVEDCVVANLTTRAYGPKPIPATRSSPPPSQGTSLPSRPA